MTNDNALLDGRKYTIHENECVVVLNGCKKICEGCILCFLLYLVELLAYIEMKNTVCPL
jgi:hypothetical protein